MRSQRIAATDLVAAQLFAAEAAIDVAISETAKLSSLMPEARISANIAAQIGQEALALSSRSLVALISARENMVETHKALDGVKTDIGLKVYGMGGGFNKGSAATALELVSEAA